MADCVILCPDSDAGYTALHEYVQGGWMPIFHWVGTDKLSHIILRREPVQTRREPE